MKVLISLAILLLGSSPVLAEPPGTGEIDVHALIQLAQNRKCVRLVKDEGGRTLVNLCTGCRKVKISHQRPGQGAPFFRDRIVPGRGRVRVGLLGPGRTRVVDDQDCGGGRQVSPASPESPELGNAPRCVRLARAGNGGLLMVNTCNTCRAVTVERVQATGRRTTSLYAVRAGATVPLAPQGAAQFRLPAEQPCP